MGSGIAAIPKAVFGLVALVFLVGLYLTAKKTYLLGATNDCIQAITSFTRFCSTLSPNATSPNPPDGILRDICHDEDLEERLSCLIGRHAASKFVLKYSCKERTRCPVAAGVPHMIKAVKTEGVVDVGDEGEDLSAEEWVKDFAYTLELNYGPSVCGENATKCRDLFSQEISHLHSLTDSVRLNKEAKLLLRAAELLPEVIWSRIAPGFFPRVFSYRFPWYVVEYSEPADNIINDADLAQRLDVAKELIKFLVKLDDYASSVFDDRLLLCDLKLEHFGMTSRPKNAQNSKETREVRFLDADTVFLKTQLPRMMAPDGTGCSSDEDCNFFDCRNIFVCRDKKCVEPPEHGLTPTRAELVLRAFCEKVVFPWKPDGMNLWEVVVGKLFGRPKRLLGELDVTALITLLPTCDFHDREKWRKTEL